MDAPRFQFGCTTHTCRPERVWVRDPAGLEPQPHGMATKLAINMIEGEPVSAQIRTAGGHYTIVPLTWLTTPPAALPGVVLRGPWAGTPTFNPSKDQ